MKMNLHSNVKGFSLVEVMMSLAIASSTMLVLAALIPSGLDMVRASNRDMATARIVQFVNAEYQMRPWADIMTQEANGSESTFLFDNQGLKTESASDYAVFGAKVIVAAAQPLPGAPASNSSLRTLHVNVTSNLNATDPYEEGPAVTQYQILVAQADEL